MERPAECQPARAAFTCLSPVSVLAQAPVARPTISAVRAREPLTIDGRLDGYNDHYREGSQLDANVFPADAGQRTHRAMFAKLQYLFRY